MNSRLAWTAAWGGLLLAAAAGCGQRNVMTSAAENPAVVQLPELREGPEANLNDLEETQAWMARLVDEARSNSYLEADQRTLGDSLNGKSVDDNLQELVGLPVVWILTVQVEDFEYAWRESKPSAHPSVYPFIVHRESILKTGGQGNTDTLTLVIHPLSSAKKVLLGDQLAVPMKIKQIEFEPDSFHQTSVRVELEQTGPPLNESALTRKSPQ